MAYDMYQEVILQHYRHPRNFGALEGAELRRRGVEPSLRRPHHDAPEGRPLVAQDLRDTFRGRRLRDQRRQLLDADGEGSGPYPRGGRSAQPGRCPAGAQDPALAGPSEMRAHGLRSAGEGAPSWRDPSARLTRAPSARCEPCSISAGPTSTGSPFATSVVRDRSRPGRLRPVRSLHRGLSSECPRAHADPTPGPSQLHGLWLVRSVLPGRSDLRGTDRPSQGADR